MRLVSELAPLEPAHGHVGGAHLGCVVRGCRRDGVALRALGEEFCIPGAHAPVVRVVLWVAFEKYALLEFGERSQSAAAEGVHFGVGAFREFIRARPALGSQCILDRQAHAREEPADLFRIAMRDAELRQAGKELK